MRASRKRAVNALTLALASAFAAGTFGAQAAAVAPRAEKAQTWTAAGGTVGVRWNKDLAGDIGMVFGSASGRQTQLSWNQNEMFALRPAGSLEFDVRDGNLRGFIGGRGVVGGSLSGGTSGQGKVARQHRHGCIQISRRGVA